MFVYFFDALLGACHAPGLTGNVS